MERLSDATIAIINELHTERLDYNSEYIPLIEAVHKLADYENTGLSSEDVSILAAAKENGRLLELMYPIGSKVFCLYETGVLDKHISEQIVHGYAECEWRGTNNIGKDSRFIVTIHSSRQCNDHALIWQLKNVYRTYEDAVSALAARTKV